MEWFKFYGAEYLGDPKIRNFSAEYHSCWLHLLCFAANSSTPGIVEYLDEENLMLYAGIDPMSDEWTRTLGVMESFEKRGMVKREENRIIINNWNKRQQQYMTNAERQKQYRERKRYEALQRPLQQVTTRIEQNRKEKKVSKDTGKQNADGMTREDQLKRLSEIKSTIGRAKKL